MVHVLSSLVTCRYLATIALFVFSSDDRRIHGCERRGEKIDEIMEHPRHETRVRLNI